MIPNNQCLLLEAAPLPKEEQMANNRVRGLFALVERWRFLLCIRW